jgi:putative nucleotidyltransferase with HDIG domain
LKPVHVVADTSERLVGICAVLERKYDVTSELLTGAKLRRGTCRAVVVKADLRVVENIEALRTTLGSMAHVRKRIFLLDQTVNLGIAQAYALGATLVLAGPIGQAKLLSALADRTDPVADVPAVNDENDASSAGAAAMASMFEAVATGTAIDVKGARDAGRKIAERVAEKGISHWLTTVRRHHEGTFQHCLLVTGVAVDFGLSLGLPKRDMERLYTAAMFHDLGKATIPLAVLDKPGRLDPQERAIIETHPVLGYDALKNNKEISPEILDAVRHHHEFLDGSGYPDALCAESICDVVRILTISDIFAALIEDRRYKAPMPRDQAYEILCGMQGKLEKVLVAAFRPVALDR